MPPRYSMHPMSNITTLTKISHIFSKLLYKTSLSGHQSKGAWANCFSRDQRREHVAVITACALATRQHQDSKQSKQ